MTFPSARANLWVTAALAVSMSVACSGPPSATGPQPVESVRPVGLPDGVEVTRVAGPESWSNTRLAAQLTYTCVQMDDPAARRRAAAAGVGGIALFGKPPARLAGDLRQVRALTPGSVKPLIGSDEEGGAVQRLRTAIYRLPNAATMGTWSDARIERTAYDYGMRMRRLGVTMDFAPVADLAIPGYYIAELKRGFAQGPGRTARAVKAWSAGLQRAQVTPVVKHWPGHGQASNSHTGIATAPPLSVLLRRDLRPFVAAFAAGAPAVMVGHLRVAGLTEAGVPTSESPRALHLLRQQAGPDTVIITDDLSMAAASTALGFTTVKAATRALRAGADMALVCGTPVAQAVGAIRRAIDTGYLPRAQAIQSVRRIVGVKSEV